MVGQSPPAISLKAAKASCAARESKCVSAITEQLQAVTYRTSNSQPYKDLPRSEGHHTSRDVTCLWFPDLWDFST